MKLGAETESDGALAGWGGFFVLRKKKDFYNSSKAVAHGAIWPESW